jgi:hypothetical protein
LRERGIVLQQCRRALLGWLDAPAADQGARIIPQARPDD